MEEVKYAPLEAGEVLAALWNNAVSGDQRKIAAFYFGDEKLAGVMMGIMSPEKGAALIRDTRRDHNGIVYFDYIDLKCMKVGFDIGRSVVNVRNYDREYGEGAAKNIIDELMRMRGITPESHGCSKRNEDVSALETELGKCRKVIDELRRRICNVSMAMRSAPIPPHRDDQELMNRWANRLDEILTGNDVSYFPFEPRPFPPAKTIMNYKVERGPNGCILINGVGLDIEASDRMKRTYRAIADYMYDKVKGLRFDPSWEVFVVPPFGGAMARFVVRKGEKTVSVYCDWFSELGRYGSHDPYWEVCPYKDDVARFDIFDVDGMMKAVREVIEDGK